MLKRIHSFIVGARERFYTDKMKVIQHGIIKTTHFEQLGSTYFELTDEYLFSVNLMTLID